MSDDIHSCSLYCTRPSCVLSQRNEFRDKLFKQQAEPVVTEPIATICREADRQQIEFHTYIPEGETIRLYAMPPMQPAASLMTNVESGDVELVWNDDGFSKTLWRETVLYKIGGGNE